MVSHIFKKQQTNICLLWIGKDLHKSLVQMGEQKYLINFPLFYPVSITLHTMKGI